MITTKCSQLLPILFQRNLKNGHFRTRLKKWMMSSQIVDDQLIHSDGETEAEFKKGSKWRASLRQGLKKTRKLTSTIKQTTQEQLQKINEKRNHRDDKVITGCCCQRLITNSRLTLLNGLCHQSHRRSRRTHHRREIITFIFFKLGTYLESFYFEKV